MSSYVQQQQAPQAAYSTPNSYPQSGVGYPPAYVAPPPAGCPMKDGAIGYPLQASAKTKSRGKGFWEGCCAALCCCCVLETCF